MGKIRILDEDTVRKIAAGEVVERPASVVKELVENSIDASATKISVSVLSGGKKEIVVVDNGIGMDSEDAILAFERHATSKIRSARDLFGITTLGFRGEALASIGAVSKIDLTTRCEGCDVGVRVRVEAGKIVSSERVGCPVGTSIRVRDLFFNTPARRKYMKSDRTEFAHVASVLMERALAYPKINISLVHNGRVVFSAPPADDKVNIGYVLGMDVAKNMIEVSYINDVEITGFIAPPQFSRKSADWSFFIVNGRPIKNSSLLNALIEAYGGMIEKGRYPVAVLRINVAPESVDVNVHPTKIYVRFADERSVCRAISNAVREALSSADLRAKGEYIIKHLSVPQITGKDVGGEVRVEHEARPVMIEQKMLVEDKKVLDGAGMLSGAIYLGQLWNTYILLQAGDEFVLIDQHAAHERVRYESLKEAYRRGYIAQQLIEPIIITLRPNEFAILLEYSDKLKELGISIEEFGKNTVKVSAVPTIVGRVCGKDEIRAIIEDIIRIGKVDVETFADEVLKIAACHTAIRAGEKLDTARVAALVEEMNNTKNRFTCPHGRPAIIVFKKSELERMFRRRK